MIILPLDGAWFGFRARPRRFHGRNHRHVFCALNLVSTGLEPRQAATHELKARIVDVLEICLFHIPPALDKRLKESRAFRRQFAKGTGLVPPQYDKEPGPGGKVTDFGTELG